MCVWSLFGQVFLKLPASSILTAETTRGCGLAFRFFSCCPLELEEKLKWKYFLDLSESIPNDLL